MVTLLSDVLVAGSGDPEQGDEHCSFASCAMYLLKDLHTHSTLNCQNPQCAVRHKNFAHILSPSYLRLFPLLILFNSTYHVLSVECDCRCYCIVVMLRDTQSIISAFFCFEITRCCRFAPLACHPQRATPATRRDCSCRDSHRSARGRILRRPPPAANHFCHHT